MVHAASVSRFCACYSRAVSRARTDGAGGTAATLLALACVVTSVSPAAAQTGAPEVPPGYATPPPSDPLIVQPQPAGPQIVRSQPLVVVPAYAPPIVPVASPPVRPQTIVVERSESIRALWLPGVIALPIAWISTWTSASSVFEGDALTYAWIPLIGPWLMLTQDLNGYEAGFVVLGVVQGAAALMMILGLTLRRSWTETQYVVDPIQGARVSFDAIALPGGGVAGVQLQL